MEGQDQVGLLPWRDAATDMVVPYDASLGMHPQSEMI